MNEAIGWTLVHSLWEGACIAAVLAAALSAVRSPRARYAAACAALAAMLVGFAITMVRALPERWPAARPAAARFVGDMTGATGPVAPSDSGLAAAAPWLAPFWIAGVCVFYLRHAAGWILVSRLRRRGVCLAPERWQRELARLRARLRVSRPVLLMESCLAEAPLVIGHFRPVVLMPVELLAGMPAGHIEAVLLHELAHIRRHDYLVNVLQRAVEGLLFYHPAVWWISRVIRSERENCCDDAAVATTGDPHGYAAALGALEHYRWPGDSPAVAAAGGNLVKRIRRLLYPAAPAGSWAPLVSLAILAAGAALTLAARPSQPPAENSPYRKWLNEDVVYIISPEERAAFIKLTTDEERDQFIEQFWLRRDPTPGTSRNEFKEEHYRRIAYAGEHFAGWANDRARIYILVGPPDEIESHPGSTPRENWLYRRIDGVGDNVIFEFTGPEYRLGRDPLSLRTGPVRVPGEEQQRKLIAKVDPKPPAVASVHGVVRFDVLIDRDGRVSNLQLVSGHPLLAPAAAEAVRQWLWEPTLLQGQPVEVLTQLDVKF
jgi:GWxTD domain-containing protein